MEWDVGNLALIAFSTFVSVTAFKYGWNDAFGLIIGLFFGLLPYVSIFTEPGTILAVFVGVSPYIGYQLFQFTPAGRRRKAEQDMREAQERSDEIKELERIQKQHAALAAAKKAAEQSRLDEIAREEQFLLGEIARGKTRRLNESLEWISVRTWGENVLAKGPTAERH